MIFQLVGVNIIFDRFFIRSKLLHIVLEPHRKFLMGGVQRFCEIKRLAPATKIVLKTIQCSESQASTEQIKVY